MGSIGHDPEREVWRGRYSPKAIVGSAIAAGLVSVALLIVAIVVRRSETTWLALGGIPIVWLVLGMRFAYRRISIEYRLTNLWFEHKTGLLARTSHRMDVIDIEDIEVQQSPIERLTGVGTIRIDSTDRNDPKLFLLGIDDVTVVGRQFDEVRLVQRRRRSLRVEGNVGDVDGHST